MTTRRDFLRQSATVLAAGMLMPHALHAGAPKKQTAASDRLNVALVGCRSMGWHDLSDIMRYPGTSCVALCDIDSGILSSRAAEAEKNWGKRPALYGDYRRVLERDDVDIIVVGTPDHWHCLITTDACSAGKDVYVEKPLANSIAECDAMVAAAQRYGRVVQVGQQQRSAELWHSMKQYIDSGELGHIGRVNVWANFSYAAILNPAQDGPVPEGVDFDMWLGPAPKRTFNASRFHGSWRMFWDYGGGLLTDWGVHLLDMALWGMDVEGMPQRVVAAGGNLAYPNNFSETFDTLSVTYQFPDYLIQWSNVAIESGPYGRNYGLEFKGTNGTLIANRESWEVIPQGDKLEAKLVKPSNNDHLDHTKNFLDCVKRRDMQTACPITNGSLCAKYAHIGNIAARTHQVLTYDDSKHTFYNREADRFITPAYRKPWKL
ncbi:MAG: Gfo/Idh/MocA family oxidoreductase [Bacteroidaceae bacterium]|nr:Gfo/Idh/MocA family oxidoreductase [Bacteroidaceae bacterium]